MNMNIALSISVCGLMLAGCSSGSSAASISSQNASFFAGRVSDNTMRGAFNPDGFTAAQVQQLVQETCQSGSLSGFSTQPQPDDLVAFAASCEVWRDGAIAVEYERSDTATVVIEITGNSAGNLTYSRIDTTL